MKRVWLFFLIVLASGCFFLMITTRSQENGVRLQPGIAREVIRFHVRANSEDVQDQEIKMQVKNAVVSYLQPILENVGNVGQAKEVLFLQLSRIRQVAEEVLEQQGCSYRATVALQKEYFPQKTYGDCTFPAGDYAAVVIELGSGQGKNWWCMLYPRLCFVDETYAVVSEEKKEELQYVLTNEEYDWITDPKNRKITFQYGWLQSAVDGLRDLIRGR